MVDVTGPLGWSFYFAAYAHALFFQCMKRKTREFRILSSPTQYSTRPALKEPDFCHTSPRGLGLFIMDNIFSIMVVEQTTGKTIVDVVQFITYHCWCILGGGDGGGFLNVLY